MSPTFTHTFEHLSYRGTVSLSAGIYIDGKFSDGADGKLIDVLNPTNGNLIGQVSEGTSTDVDRAVLAAQRAYETLIDAHAKHLAAIETLNNGMAFTLARDFQVPESAACFYYGASERHTNVSRALSVARRLHAGTVWVNEYTKVHMQVPFGGFKQSGIGRECGKYALANYTNVKAVHVNVHGKL